MNLKNWATSLTVCITYILSTCSAQEFYVAVPNTIRLDTDETIAIAVDGTVTQMVDVEVSEYAGKVKTLFQSSLTVRPGEPEVLKIRLNADDLSELAFTYPQIANYVRLVVKSGAFKKEATIPISLKSGYVFMQTDKPIYTPKDKVMFRIIPLNEDGKPSDKEIRLQIRNPKDIIVKEKIFTKRNLKQTRNFFVSHVYRFGAYPLFGDWSATVNYGYQFNQNTTVKFKLQEYVLPIFTVKLKTQEVILPTAKIIRILVDAKYVFGKPVEGIVSFRFGVKDSKTMFFGALASKRLNDGKYEVYVDTNELKQRKNVGWFPQIEGSYFVVEATVKDFASGNREVAFDAKSRFSISPFVISFQRCLGDFKPGLISVIEADVSYGDGRPASGISTVITAIADNDNNKPLKISNPNSISDNEGRVSFKIHPEMNHNTVTVTIKTTDERFEGNQATGHYTQEKVISKNGAYIAIVRSSGKILSPATMFAETIHIEPAEISDIYYLVVSKGKIMKIGKLPHGRFKIPRVEFMVTYDMAPSFRLVVFANYNGELIADSLKVDVGNECHPNADINLNPDFKLDEPGKAGKIVIRGSKSILVGLLAVDEAVYALSSQYLLTKSKIFNEMKMHDFGCGPGGGLTSNRVLENAGVVIITNSYSPTNQAAVLKCDEKIGKKKKREIISPKFNTSSERLHYCCALGMDKDSYGQKCEERSKIRRVRRMIGNHMPEPEFIPMEEEHYFERELTVRSDLRETWIFDDIQIGPDNEEEYLVSLPHSITTWVIQAVSVSEEYGMCVTTPQRLKSFKKVFLQLNLPYSVVRNEQIEIQAALFNYGDTKLSAVLYMYGVKDLCSGIQEREKSERKILVVEPYSAQTVTFPIIPLKEGIYDIEVTALSMEGGDVIMRKLNVVADGQAVEKDIILKLDPSNQQKRLKKNIQTDTFSDSIDASRNMQVTTVKLNLPENCIPGTESCIISVLGDISPTVATSIKDFSRLILIPRGSGESNMIYFGSTLYMMHYLKVTGQQMTRETEDDGYDYIRLGYGNQLKFRKDDGSFGAGILTPSSVWLTAFVTKVFCQASRMVHTEEAIVCSGIEWLVTKQQPDGSFIDNHPVVQKDMMGGVKGQSSMTAFVLITLQECSCDVPNLDMTKAKAVAYLEEHLGDVVEPMPLAIVTYALALADSDLKKIANDKLFTLSKYHKEQNTLFWETGSSTSNVETASYALLSQLLFNDKSTCNSIVNWLNTKTFAKGSSTMQGTVMALQALSEYTIQSRTFGVNLVSNVTSSSDRIFHSTFRLDEKNAHVLQQIHVKKVRGTVFLNTAGHGIGLLSVKLRYNVHYLKEMLCRFEIKADVTEEKEDDLFDKDIYHDLLMFAPGDLIKGVRAKREANTDNSNLKLKVQICIKYLGEQEAGMSIVDAGIFSGFKPNEDDLELLQKSSKDHIQGYEQSSRGVVFYLEKIPVENAYCFSFRITRELIVGIAPTNIIKVYEYNNPDDLCTFFYNSINENPKLRIICSNRDCQCAEGGCPPHNPFANIRDLPRKDMRTNLIRIACANHDYGIENSEVVEDETRLLIAKDTCDSAALLIDQLYLIMGKDGEKYETKDGDIEYRYLLDKSTSIHLWNEGPRGNNLVDRALVSMKRKLKNDGCDFCW